MKWVFGFSIYIMIVMIVFMLDQVYVDYNVLGNKYYANGEYIKAENAYKKSLNINEKTFGKDSEEVLVPLAGLAAVYERLTDFSTSFDQHSMYEMAYKIWDRIVPLVEKYCEDDPKLIKYSKFKRTQMRKRCRG